jgi:hypothetical protein
VSEGCRCSASESDLRGTQGLLISVSLVKEKMASPWEKMGARPPLCVPPTVGRGTGGLLPFGGRDVKGKRKDSRLLSRQKNWGRGSVTGSSSLGISPRQGIGVPGSGEFLLSHRVARK